MSRTVTALYDTRAEAEAASQRLSSQFNLEGRARIIDKSSSEGGQGSSDFHRVPLSSEDRHAYGEGLNRGGFMLCAEIDEDEDADRVISILEETSSVDMDERQNSWRQEGWSGQSQFGQSQTGRSQSDQGQTGHSQTALSGTRDNIIEEERIPIVQEELRVGKREVERGGARVRSYVEERPVSEQVNLREEHVSIERHPVDQQLSSSDFADNKLLQERTVEMRERSEEAVIGKDARVTEEVVVQKTADQRTENVQDTVRETKVEVDDDVTSR
jgi:uncharacterized protein (TIGR02271 family)